jgi:hypothetical protein
VSRDMPPGGGPSEGELAELEAWLDCGAPGEERALPQTSAFPSGLGGYGLVARVVEDSPGVLLVMRDLQDVGFGLPQGTYIVESYEIEADEAWFHGFWIYDGDDEIDVEVWWDPPLHVQGSDVDETQATEALVTQNGSTETVSQVWTWTRELVLGGGLEQDPTPTEIVMSESSGLLQLWHISDDRGFTAREFSIEDGRSWDLLQQSSDVSLPSGLAFPVEQGANWIERLVLDGGS